MYLKVCRLVVGRLIRRTVKATVNYHLGIEGYFSDPEKFNKFQSIVTKSIKFTTIGILGLSIIGAITVLFFQLPHEFQITEKNLSPIGMNEMNIYDHINRGNTDFIDPTIL